jgi:hypothetical protein
MKTCYLGRTPAALLLVLAAVLLAAFQLGAAPVPKDRPADKDVLYFPTKVGAKWVYEGNEGRTEVVTAVEQKPKEEVWVVTVDRVNKDGKVINEERKWEVSKQGLRLVGTWLTRDREPKPHTFLKLPHRAGEKWAFNPDLDEFQCVALEKQRVKVPAGEFDAVGIEIQLGRKESITWWFAPDVGMVRMGDEKKPSCVLKSFTPGKEKE